MPACWGGPVWHGTTFEYGEASSAEGSPFGLVASKNHSRPGYKYSRFLSTSAVRSPGYGWVLETSAVDRKLSLLRLPRVPNPLWCWLFSWPPIILLPAGSGWREVSNGSRPYGLSHYLVRIPILKMCLKGGVWHYLPPYKISTRNH
jgi:hypothetical protein